MNNYGLRVLSWVFRLLAVAVVIGGAALVLMAMQIDFELHQVAAERGIVTEPYNPLPVIVGGLALALILYTVGTLLALLVDLEHNTRETADALRRIRGKR